MSHVHSYTRSKPDATVETCHCGAFRHTEHSGPSIAEEKMQKLDQTLINVAHWVNVNSTEIRLALIDAGERGLVTEMDEVLKAWKIATERVLTVV